MNRYFSSPALFNHIWSCETECVGTVMTNRKEMPIQLFSQKLKKGDKVSAQRDNLLAIKLRDIRDVHILTTSHEDKMVKMPQSRGAHQKTKPLAIVDYNKNKIGVDKSNQLIAYYSATQVGEMVEKAILPSFRSCNSECTYFT